MSMRKLLIFLLILFFEFSIFAINKPVVAKADDLVIDDNGSVSLIITDSSVVMGAATSAPSAAPVSTSAPSATSAPTTPKPAVTPVPKIVPVAPANTNTKVIISPVTTDKKLNITIETKKTSENPVPTAITKPSQTTAPLPSPGNTITTQKTVDNVILRNADKEPVLTIQADKNQDNQVNIKQQGVNVTTNLPIQIDSKTHQVSVSTGLSTSDVNILPDQAVKGANEKLTTSTLSVVSSNVSLIEDRGQAEYVVNQTKTGKLLGLFNVTLPSQVKISAKTGKTISAWQSPLAYFSGFLIK